MEQAKEAKVSGEFADRLQTVILAWKPVEGILILNVCLCDQVAVVSDVQLAVMIRFQCPHQRCSHPL